MRLDTEVLRGLLSDLAKASKGGGGEAAAADAAAFAADVHAALGRTEAVLKVVGSPAEGTVDTFFELLPHASPSDFQRIVDLKVRVRERVRVHCMECGGAAGWWAAAVMTAGGSRRMGGGMDRFAGSRPVFADSCWRCLVLAGPGRC